jgi:hypothetical protein
VASATWEDRPAWLFIEQTQGAMGGATDSLFVDRATLVPLRRMVHQGPATVELTFRGDSAVGQISAGPQQMPIRAKVVPPVFIEGGALRAGIATLPLNAGTTAGLRIFDLLSGSAREQRIEVGAVERVQVPAGEFAVVRVEVKPADGSPGGSTLWIEQAAPHRIVRMEGSLPPQAGGGKAIAELR